MTSQRVKDAIYNRDMAKGFVDHAARYHQKCKDEWLAALQELADALAEEAGLAVRDVVTAPDGEEGARYVIEGFRQRPWDEGAYVVVRRLLKSGRPAGRQVPSEMIRMEDVKKVETK